MKTFSKKTLIATSAMVATLGMFGLAQAKDTAQVNAKQLAASQDDVAIAYDCVCFTDPAAETVTGTIQAIDPATKMISVKTADGTIKKIAYSDKTHLQLASDKNNPNHFKDAKAETDLKEGQKVRARTTNKGPTEEEQLYWMEIFGY